MKEKGVSIPRPEYDGVSTKIDAEEEKAEKVKTGESEEEEENVKPATTGRLDKFKHKANHEATSDEDN